MKIRISTARAASVALAVLAAGAVISAPAASATSRLTAAQRTLVTNTLARHGISPTVISAVLADPSVAATVPTSVSASTTAGVPSTAMQRPSNLGSSCYGSSNWVKRTQYVNNMYGQHLAYTALRTDFCYSGGRVVYAHSTPSHYIYLWARVGQQWEGFGPLSEGFYIYYGHTNGGASAMIEGTFDMCLLKYGCIYQEGTVERTFVHYNGTWAANGSSYN